MNPQEPLMYSIMCGILLVLSVMMAITCLLVHHNKQLDYLKKEVKQNRVQQQQRHSTVPKAQSVAYDTHRKDQISEPYDDGYIEPNTLVHSTLGKKHKPYMYQNQHPSTAYMNHNKTFANADSQSEHSYESVGKFCA